MNTGLKLSDDFKSKARHFVYYYFNGTLNRVVEEKDILTGIDYRHQLVTEASLVEQAFAIYFNNVRLDDNGKVLNQSHSIRRAAQYIRSICDRRYVIDPPLEEWEIELL